MIRFLSAVLTIMAVIVLLPLPADATCRARAVVVHRPPVVLTPFVPVVTAFAVPVYSYQAGYAGHSYGANGNGNGGGEFQTLIQELRYSRLKSLRSGSKATVHSGSARLCQWLVRSAQRVMIRAQLSREASWCCSQAGGSWTP